ncbi:lactonase family protein [Paenibacillus sp. CMAA1739]|uniref:lactonase family protein n=1 Tax=Paenibacillus ottowii TaxID=2315729 RepID=UPI0027302ACE|nr:MULTISPECIES: lactonase family protein [Paenibacillus]MDP1510855.1 lactonase family protein [Paenibacillus ottowii]MEC4566649.1 lactonase family protein [Paenibacillus sp. CMAA1739]
MTAQQKLLVFAGSYAELEGNGVYSYTFNEETGALTLQDEFSGLKNPTFLNVDVKNRKLYSIGETTSAAGAKVGEASAFEIDPVKGTFTLLNRAENVGSTTCHIQRDPSDRYLIVVSYHGGMVGLVSLTEDGRIGELLDVKQHEGKGAHPERQDRPHPHSSFFSPDGRFLFVQDLGLDLIRVYTIDDSKGQLVLHGETKTHAGAGPRHLTFHPNGKFAFVINEVDSTITSFAYDAEAGKLTELESVPTLPADFTGENTTAEIAISQDGAYLYGSNRGHDSIVVYAVDAATGKLSLVEHVSAEGEHPRHFALTPNGDYMLVANRDTNNIVTFKVDKASGRLTYTGQQVTVSKPVCVQPFYFSV